MHVARGLLEPLARRRPRRRRRAARRSRPSRCRLPRRARARPRRRRRRSPAARPGARGRRASRSTSGRRPSGRRRSCRAGSSRPSRSCSGRASAPCRPSASSSRRRTRGRRRRRARGRPARASSDPATAVERDRQGSGLGGSLERGEHVGRAAARADADDGVRGGDARAPRPRAARRRRRPRQPRARPTRARRRRRAPRPGRARWRRSLRIPRRRAAAMRPDEPAPDVDEPPAGREPRDDRVDRRCELVRHRGHRGRDRRVLVVHQLDELRGRARVVVRVRAPRLGHELVQAPGSLARRHRPESKRAGARWSIPVTALMHIWSCFSGEPVLFLSGPMAEIELEHLTKVYSRRRDRRGRRQPATSATASSWCSSARPAAASRRCCG